MLHHYSPDFSFFFYSYSRRKLNQQKTSSKRNQGLLGRGNAGVKERPWSEINIGGNETESPPLSVFTKMWVAEWHQLYKQNFFVCESYLCTSWKPSLSLSCFQQSGHCRDQELGVDHTFTQKLLYSSQFIKHVHMHHTVNTRRWSYIHLKGKQY